MKSRNPFLLASALLLLAAVPGRSLTPSSPVPILAIGNYSTGNFFFSANIGQGPQNFYFAVTDDYGKAMMNIVLTAYSLGKNVFFDYVTVGSELKLIDIHTI